MQILTTHGESAAPMMPPATGGLFYYPGQWRGRFPSLRAALPSIGCSGDFADAQVRSQFTEASGGKWAVFEWARQAEVLQ